jgi:hypothetical protein
VIIAPDDADEPTLYTIAQFVVPKLACQLVDLGVIEREAAASGVERPRIEQNTKGAGAGKVRLTCRVMMVYHLLLAWGDLSEGKRPLRVPGDERERAIEALRLACESGVAAIAEATSRQHRKIPLGESGYLATDG